MIVVTAVVRLAKLSERKEPVIPIKGIAGLKN
jgi:hypothetical protein